MTGRIDRPFEATANVTEAAVIDALEAAVTTIGRAWHVRRNVRG